MLTLLVNVLCSICGTRDSRKSAACSRFSPCFQLGIQIITQNDGVVMLGIVSAVEQCDAPVPRLGQNRFPGIGASIKLRTVAALEFRPSGGIVIEPAAQFGTGGGVLEPCVHLKGCFLDSAGPEPLDQEPRSVSRRVRIVN